MNHFDEQRQKIEAVLREIANQIASLAKQKAHYSMERVLFDAISELQFYGNVTAEQSPSDAIAAAAEASSKHFADDQHIVIFVDGSLVWKPNGTSGSIAHLGAAVVYKSLDGSQGWEKRRYFAISKERNSHKAELFAIAQGAAVAIELINRLRRRNSNCSEKMATSYRVTIFSDCRSALGQVKHLREISSGAKAQLCSDPNICKLIMRSQRLHQIGVHLELCWVPGHFGVEGNVHADEAAQQAAKIQGIAVPVDGGPHWIELEAPSEE